MFQTILVSKMLFCFEAILVSIHANLLLRLFWFQKMPALFEAILVSNMVSIFLLRLFWFQQMLTLFEAILVSKSANVVWNYSGFKHASCWWGYSSFNTSVRLDLWSGVFSVCGQDLFGLFFFSQVLPKRWIFVFLWPGVLLDRFPSQLLS